MSRSLFALVYVCLAGTALAAGATPHKAVRTVYLVRHGFYDEIGPADPDTAGLLSLGRQQARLVAARLDAMPVRFTSLQCSSMKRARQTAELIAPRFPDLKLDVRDDIRECTMATRRRDIMEELAPGEAAACEKTLEGAWKRIFTPASGDVDENDIVVCHGNVIRWFVTKALDVDPTAWLGMSVAHASLTTIVVRPDGSCKVLGVGDSGHIPPEMTTFTGGDPGQ